MPACKNCGTDNAADAIYCEDCGAQLNSTPVSDNQPKIPQSGAVIRWNELELPLTELLETGGINRYLAHLNQSSYLVYISQDAEALRKQIALTESVQSPSEHGKLLVATAGECLNEWSVAVAPLPEAQRLSQVIGAGGALSEIQAEKLARALLSTLSPVHAANLVIASLQPSRVWINSDQQVWLDIVDRTATTLEWEQRNDGEMGPLSVAAGFSPPELYGLGQVCTSSDLFSAAAILYFVLNGQTPNFESREQFFVANPVVTNERPALGYIINKSLQKFNADRFDSSNSMLAALDQPVPEATVSVTAAPRPTPHFGAQTTPPSPRGSAPSNGHSVAPYGAHSSPRTRFRIATRSDVGCVRSINQDACLELNFWFFEKSQPRHAQLLAVIDGMGGEAEGDKAASIALRSIAQEVVGACMTLRDGRQTAPLVGTEPGEKFPLILGRALESANRNIFEYACLKEDRKGMGCTISACIVVENQAYFAHVGDTRGYHFRVSAADHPRLEQVTTDHSLVGRLVAMGSLTPEEARHSPQRSIIFRAMGTNPDVEVDIYHRSLETGDRILLCSDGVWEYFEAGELSSLVESCPTPESVCQKLVDICLDRGADDNATLAVLEFIG